MQRDSPASPESEGDMYVAMATAQEANVQRAKQPTRSEPKTADSGQPSTGTQQTDKVEPEAWGAQRDRFTAAEWKAIRDRAQYEYDKKTQTKIEATVENKNGFDHLIDTHPALAEEDSGSNCACSAVGLGCCS